MPKRTPVRSYSRLLPASSMLLMACTVLSYGIGFLGLAIGDMLHQNREIPPPVTHNLERKKETVLGAKTENPQFIIHTRNSEFYGGGLLTQSIIEPPSVDISSYNYSGNLRLDVYEANTGILTDYLLHDKDFKQTVSNIDTSQLVSLAVKNVDLINTANNSSTKVDLPIEKPGIYLLRVTAGEAIADNILIRADKAVLLKRGEKDFVFWGQDLKTKRSVSSGVVQTFSFLGEKKILGNAGFDKDGVAKIPFDANADVALITVDNSISLLPINLRYLNTGWNYASWQERQIKSKYFIFTDRPLYRPGDKIFFKSVIRNDNDAVYSIPSGNAEVKIYKDWDEKQSFFTTTMPISPDGTVYGEADLPQGLATGMYSLKVNIPRGNQENYFESNYTFFQVEFFRKPEYYLDVAMGADENISGDKTSFKISGFYFSGTPLAGQTVNYKIYSSDYYDYEYYMDKPGSLLADYRYSYWGKNTPIKTGSGVLDDKGELHVSLDTKIEFLNGKNQIFSVEATYDNGSGNPALSRKNILVYSGEYGIYRTDNIYGSKTNSTVNLALKLVPWKQANIGNIPLTAKLVRNYWEQVTNENQKYPTYTQKTDNLPDLKAVSDTTGKAVFSFYPTKPGSYKLDIQGVDTRGNTVQKSFYLWVIDYDLPFYGEQYNSGLTVKTDREKYTEGSTAVLTINSEIPDRDVFISLERDYLWRYAIVHLYGKTGVLQLPLETTDIPNIFASVNSFSDMLNRGSAEIIVPADSKKIITSISPDRKNYGPSENISLNIHTTDQAGNPIPAEMAVYAVDKAIFELTDGKPVSIYDYFWSKRYNNTQTTSSYEGISVIPPGGMGGCFTAGTKILMADGSEKNIEEVKIGDKVLTRISENDSGMVAAAVEGIHSVEETGYLIVNGGLEVTPQHLLYVNDAFKEAGSIQIGEYLRDSQNRKVFVNSIEWQEGKIPVYNLRINKYHTYFAGGIWVHNEKGDGAARSVFKDTAYWNPVVRTDISGNAIVRFKLPDNLTTWVIAVVASTPDTKVGQALTEVVVSKDVVLRPILPNIMRVGDKMIVSALLANDTENSLTFDAGLSFDSGAVEIATHSGITVKAKDTKQLSWSVLPLQDNDKGLLTFSAVAREKKESSDKVVSPIPVYPYGFYETKAETGDGEKTFTVKPSADANPDKSTVSLMLSPSLLGMMPAAISYLINYPYGCVEQTTSRFVPAVIAKANPAVFASIIEGKDIDDIIAKGVARLKELQHPDGGWSWWSSGESELFTTSYVTEYLLMAKENGVVIDDYLLGAATGYIDRYQVKDLNKQDEVILKNYALTVTKSTQPKMKMDFTPNVKADIYSLWVLTNLLNGVSDPQDNGLNGLIALGKSQGDGIYWEAGEKLRFGSVDASTALALRAISLSGKHRETAAKAVRFLLRNRKYGYFSNTFGTAQVVRALAEFAKTGSELSPNFNYTVTLDGKEVGSGSVTDSKSLIKEQVFPFSDLKQGGSNLSVALKGEGQLYSTLLVKELHTDKNAKAVSHGISIKRDYLTTKGDASTIAVGDEVTVRLTVNGLTVDENYGLIDDDLPAGLIPVNEKLKNEQNSDNLPYYYDGSGREGKENGMLLSLYQVAAGERTYTYKARAVTEGVYSVSPATATLMYAPEIYGRSAAGTITISGRSLLPEVIKEYVTPTAAPKAKPKSFIAGLTGNKSLYALGILLIPAAVLVYIIISKKKNKPPYPPVSSNPTAPYQSPDGDGRLL